MRQPQITGYAPAPHTVRQAYSTIYALEYHDSPGPNEALVLHGDHIGITPLYTNTVVRAITTAWFKLNDGNSFPVQVHADFSSQIVIFGTSSMGPFEGLT